MIRRHSLAKVAFLAIFTLMLTCGAAIAQSLPDIPLSFRFKSQSLESALQSLARKVDFELTYNPNNLEGKIVDERFKKQAPATILDALLHPRGLAWKAQKGLIVVYPAPRAPALPTSEGIQYTLSGYVEDSTTGERLIGATVYEAHSQRGIITNAYGYFSLQVPADSLQLWVSYIGYAKQIRQIRLSKDQKLLISLKPDLELETVEIIAEENSLSSLDNSMSRIRVPISQIKKLPAILGETDVLKTLQLLPGVQASSETNVGVVVRGGAPDQNLFLLDGVPVYNVNHLFGLFSVFNPDAIQSVDLIKGGFPAQYGGRLSSIVDIRMREGNRKEFKGNATVGLISAKCTVEGPLTKGKNSFLLSARRTWIDLITRPISALIFNSPGESGSFGYQFYDLNAKFNQQLGKRDRLYLSFYTGRDGLSNRSSIEFGDFENEYKFRLKWGNLTSALRWNREISSRLFSNVTATFSTFDFKINALTQLVGQGQTGLQNRLSTQSGIRDLNLKADFDLYAAPRHLMHFGAGLIGHRYIPEKAGVSIISASLDSVTFTKDAPSINALEGMLWWEDNWSIGPRLQIRPGFHASAFQVENSLYPTLQPRMSLRYTLPKDIQFKASYAGMAQFIHLLSNSGVGLPTDLWVPVTDSIPPLQSQQYAAGLSRKFPKIGLELSLEGFYKEMDQLIDYRSGASLLSPAYWETQVEKNGKGWTYGLEIFAQKKTGKLSGWVGYAWNRSWRKFERINEGRRYPSPYERRHQITVAGNWEIKKGLEFSWTWQFNSGNRVTFPEAIYFAPSQGDEGVGFRLGMPMERGVQLLLDYGERNSFQLPAFHRLDLGLRLSKKTNWGERAWAFGLYNAYSRRNPFFVYLRYEGPDFSTGQPILKARLVSLLPIIPYASFNFSF